MAGLPRDTVAPSLSWREFRPSGYARGASFRSFPGVNGMGWGGVECRVGMVGWGEENGGCTGKVGGLVVEEGHVWGCMLSMGPKQWRPTQPQQTRSTKGRPSDFAYRLEANQTANGSLIVANIQVWH